MRNLLAAAVAFALVGTGCAIVVPSRSRSAVSEQKCPPGHRWSDGQCHSTGKGHDPAKHKN